MKLDFAAQNGRISRRRILRSIGMLAAAGVVRPLRAAAAEHKASSPEFRFGAQTNAWKIDPNDFSSLLSVLDQVKQIGFSGFETGFANVMHQFSSAEQARRRIAQTGLTFFGVHMFLPHAMYDPSTNLPPASLYRKIAPGAVSLGARHLIFSAAPCKTRQQVERKIAGLNEAGKYTHGLGLPLLYHNETARESQPDPGELTALYERTDPRYVSFLLDCGHAYQGGMDVPAFVRQHSARIAGLHLRDYRNGKQVVLGQGTFPLKQVAETLRNAGWRGWVLNEEERLDGVKHGAEYMKPAFQAAKEAFSA